MEIKYKNEEELRRALKKQNLVYVANADDVPPEVRERAREEYLHGSNNKEAEEKRRKHG